MPRMLKLLAIVAFALVLASTTAAGARPRSEIDETEPNDTPATANAIYSGDTISGSVSVTDTDYYALAGTNETWGYIAVLSTQYPVTLQALPSDGVTVLEEATSDGVVIALRNYVDGRKTHYLRVLSAGWTADYELRYFETVVEGWPEVEPNNTPATGTPFSFTNTGVVDPIGDVDCFTFHGREGDRMQFALDRDPEEDGVPDDFYWGLHGPSGAQLWWGSMLTDGFVETQPLTQTGTYALCVEVGMRGGNPQDTYKVGLLRNGRLAGPALDMAATWTNPPPLGAARVNDTLAFRLTVTNTSAISVPGAFDFGATLDPACLEFLAADPPVTSSTSTSLSWEGQRSDLGPGQTYSVGFTARALKPCSDRLVGSLYLAYFATGHGLGTNYVIVGDNVIYLPMVFKSAP